MLVVDPVLKDWCGIRTQFLVSILVTVYGSRNRDCFGHKLGFWFYAFSSTHGIVWWVFKKKTLHKS